MGFNLLLDLDLGQSTSFEEFTRDVCTWHSGFLQWDSRGSTLVCVASFTDLVVYCGFIISSAFHPPPPLPSGSTFSHLALSAFHVMGAVLQNGINKEAMQRSLRTKLAGEVRPNLRAVSACLAKHLQYAESLIHTHTFF
ncbi:hypothetical protein BaRGS_00029111 [Batillaria attramentaria]|uniref:Uncharacterized protein n=1 Tax=Batillaria attramentaria TaxID=370345 RepID=A0ABD0JWZ2_9CAEN